MLRASPDAASGNVGIASGTLRSFDSPFRALAFPCMDRSCWQRVPREAEDGLAAAKRRTELNAAAKRLQRAKAELKRGQG